LTLIFNTVPSVEHIFTATGSDMSGIRSLMQNLDNVVFSLVCDENGVNCLSLVNDVICRYSHQRDRLVIVPFEDSSEQDPHYDIKMSFGD
jgi:hypothetical protein